MENKEPVHTGRTLDYEANLRRANTRIRRTKPPGNSDRSLSFIFGKYKDSLIIDCKDKNYLEWILDNFEHLDVNTKATVYYRWKQL